MRSYLKDPRFNDAYGLFCENTEGLLIVGVWGNSGRIRELTGKTTMLRLFKELITEAHFEIFVCWELKKY
jgi:ABC-type Na+ transport system ATPase subunit NatA